MGDARLSEMELYIMQRFWEHGAMRTDELSALVADKAWKPTTLLTFLSRLVNKGMLRVEKQGKKNVYHPLVSHGEYTRTESRSFLNELYGGSARNFLAALVDTNELSSADLDELRAWLAAQEENHDA